MQVLPILTIMFVSFLVITIFIPNFPPAQFIYESTRMPHPAVSGAGLSVGTLMYGFTNGFFWVLVVAIAFGIAGSIKRGKPLPPMPAMSELSTPMLAAREVDDRWVRTLPSSTVTICPESDSSSALVSLLEAPECASETGNAELKVEIIEGLDSVYAGLLKNAGVSTIGDLLSVGAREIVRRRLAGEVGVSYVMLTKWVYRADLLRVKGVNPDYSALLESAGVTTVFDLSTKDPVSLSKRLKAVNREMGLVKGRIPQVAVIQGWVNDAKKLKPIVE